MARPIKIGLDYFPMDTTWDIKMRLLKARYKLEGIGLIVELYQAIYREGYALAWNEDSRILIADEVGISIERLDEIVAFAAEKGIFSDISLQKGYLTSHGIQARWIKACTDTKRKENKIPHDIDLLQHDNEFTPEETHKKPEETKEIPEFSTQIKEKEIKEKEIKREDTAPQAATPTRFTPPNLQEVRAYCKERHNAVDPERFIDFYASKGWMVGKNNMKDWKAAIRTWEKPQDDKAQHVHTDNWSTAAPEIPDSEIAPAEEIQATMAAIAARKFKKQGATV